MPAHWPKQAEHARTNKDSRFITLLIYWIALHRLEMQTPPTSRHYGSRLPTHCRKAMSITTSTSTGTVLPVAGVNPPPSDPRERRSHSAVPRPSFNRPSFPTPPASCTRTTELPDCSLSSSATFFRYVQKCQHLDGRLRIDFGGRRTKAPSRLHNPASSVNHRITFGPGSAPRVRLVFCACPDAVGG
jgi:hypothetical protein